MSSNYKLEYGPTTLLNFNGLAGLSNGSTTISSGVLNASGYVDIQVMFRIKSAFTSVDSAGSLTFLAAASTNGGGYWTEGATGQPGSITLGSPTNLARLGYADVNANNTTYDLGPFSLAAAFDGMLPEYVAVAVTNSTGAGLDGTIASGWFKGAMYKGTA